jgi:hypothetical protein
MAVFNAGMINADLVEDESEDPYELEVPALIFLDSLNLHDAAVIARNIRASLNHEWDKIITDSRIFNEQSMQLFKPKGKYFASMMDYQIFKRCLLTTTSLNSFPISSSLTN